MSNSMNVTEYLQNILKSTEVLEKRLNVNMGLLSKEYIEFINKNQQLLRQNQPVIKHAGNGGSASNAVGQEQVYKAGNDSQRMEYIGPFGYIKVTWGDLGASEEQSELRLFTTDYAKLPELCETVINTIEGRVAKLLQTSQPIYQHLGNIQRSVSFYESKKDINQEETHFLNYCKCYLAIYNNVLPWIGRIGEAADEVHNVMINGYKFLTKYG